LGYVEKTLQYLTEFCPDKSQLHILEETLKRAEAAKAGMPHQRQQWIKNGYNLFAHNIGSSQIYLEYTDETGSERYQGEMVKILRRNTNGSSPIHKLQVKYPGF
jgi:hypothetical protein